MNLRNQGDLQGLNSILAWIYVTKVIYRVKFYAGMNLRNQGDLQGFNSTLAWIYVTKVIYKG